MHLLRLATWGHCRQINGLGRHLLVQGLLFGQLVLLQLGGQLLLHHGLGLFEGVLRVGAQGSFLQFLFLLILHGDVELMLGCLLMLQNLLVLPIAELLLLLGLPGSLLHGSVRLLWIYLHPDRWHVYFSVP